MFAPEIRWLANAEISRGWEDGTFRPDAYITRDQMAAFVMRWMDELGL
ncbi:S-layer homology domain-containing protein [Brachybacterium sp. UNK5269]